jgi:protein gp37
MARPNEHEGTRRMSTKIGWTQETWNPIIGCSKISEGCANCYAEKMAYRLARMRKKQYQKVVRRDNGGWIGKTAFVESALEKPLHWKEPRMIFVCSMADLFHESVPFTWIGKIINIINLCPQHIFQILTKRSERMREFCSESILPAWTGLSQLPSNLWIGVTAENQKTADIRIPTLLQIPAAKRFISIEPCLEEIDFTEYKEEQYKCKGCGEFYSHDGDMTCNHCGYAEAETEYSIHGLIDWVIVGCESEPKRRPCKLEWIESIEAQCHVAGVPIFVKQMEINGKVEHDINKFPKHLQYQEYPK